MVITGKSLHDAGKKGERLTYGIKNYCFGPGSLCVTQVSLKLTTLLPQSPVCWNRKPTLMSWLWRSMHPGGKTKSRNKIWRNCLDFLVRCTHVLLLITLLQWKQQLPSCLEYALTQKRNEATFSFLVSNRTWGSVLTTYLCDGNVQFRDKNLL